MDITRGLESVQVGRDGVFVDDPFNEFRPYFAHERSAWLVDRDATVLGTQVALLSDAALGRLRQEFDNPIEEWGYEPPDSHGVNWYAPERLTQEASAQADAELHFHELQDPSKDREAHAIRRVELKTLVKSRERDIDAAQSYRDLVNGYSSWSDEQHEQAVKWVAVARESAIRHELTRELSERRQQDSSLPVRQIGPHTDVSALIAEQQYERDYALPSSYERGLVNPTLTVERLEGVVPRAELEQLSQQTDGPLRDWVRQQPSWWIRMRHRDLGPADKQLDRATAREIGRLRTALAAAEDKRDAALSEATEFETLDPGRAQVQRESVAGYEQQMDDLSKQLDGLAAHHDGPERWATAPKTALAAAYADEYEVRHAIATERAVERSIANPPAALVERIGPRPHQAVLGQEQLEQRQAWDKVAGELERERLGRDYAQRDGIDPPQPRSPTAEQELQAQIDAVREQQGLPPEQQLTNQREAALERS